jgi:negative regulator of sigma E activity
MNDAIKMQISAYVDGELPQNEAELLLRRLCQDVELREQAAQYMAVGRIMRGERTLVGQAQLRERIAAELDDKDAEPGMSGPTPRTRSIMRPVAGAAIAASVALAALLGLQQMSAGPELPVADGTAVAGFAEEGYTVPQATDDPLRDYHRSHLESASYLGADIINARLVDLQVREELLLNVETAAAETVEDETESSEPATSPAP